MNKAFKSVRNSSTGAVVATGEGTKARGKSSGSKLAAKLASASLAISASVALLSSGEAGASDAVPAGSWVLQASDATGDGSVVDSNSSVVDPNSLQTADDASSDASDTTTPPIQPTRRLGAQLLGATPTGSSVLYDDSTGNSITFVSTAGTKLSNVAAGSISATSMDAVNGSQLFHVTDGSTVANSAYVKVAGANDGSDNASNAGNFGVVIGAKASVSSTDGVVIGHDAHADTSGFSGTIAIGAGANATVAGYYGSTALGYQAAAIDGSTVVGYQASGTSRSTAMGREAYAGVVATALGFHASATGGSSVALGNSALSSGNTAVALGISSIASGSSSVALGANSVATDNNTVSVGNSTLTRKIVNVSAGATTTDAVNFGQLLAAGLTADTNGSPTNAFVAYDSTARNVATLGGTAGTTIKNVAAGDISSATSMDAVNGSQLYTTNQNVATNTANIATNTTNTAANTSSIDSLNTLIGTLSGGATDVVKYDSSAHDKVTLGGGTAGTTITDVKAGGLSATSMDAVNGSQLYTTNQNVATNTSNITTNTTNIAANTTDIAANTANITANTTNIAANTSSIDSLNTLIGTLSGGATDVVKYDSSAHDKVTLGGGTAGTTITDVKAGGLSATSMDAINGSQLYTTNQNVATNTADIAANTSSIDSINTQISTLSGDAADAVKYDSSAHDTITLGGGTAGTTITNVKAGGLSATSMDAINGSQLYTTNQNVATNTTDIATNTSNITTNTTNIAANTSSIDSINTQISTLSGNAADAVKYDSSAHDKVTLGGVSGTVVSNVAAGAIAATSTDAVNGSQLFVTNQDVAKNTTDIAANTASIGTLNTQMKDVVSYDSSSHDMITLGGGTAGTTITNVKAGALSATSMDAVNGSQLYATNQNVATNTTDITNLSSALNEINNGYSGIVRQDPLTQALTVGANLNGTSVNFAGLQGARLLTGVANGAVGASSKDAVNGSQLFNTSASVASALGGGASVDANGAVTAPSYSVGGTTVNDVGTAIGNLDNRVTKNTGDIAGIQNALADVTKQASNAVAYDSDDHKKVTLGGAGTENGTVQLTNVADGALSDDSTDAVNGSQLNATNSRITATENSILNIEQTLVTTSTATGSDATATGNNSNASGDNSTATGANSAASGDNSTANGANSSASGNNSTATGANSTASGDNSTANGANSSASGDSSSAIGDNASASGANSVAAGTHSRASGNGSVAIGAASNASADNSVALGANSVANEANTVSVGSAGAERRVTNVAPGINGTDAVNVNQMNQLRNDVGSSITSLQRSAFGGIAAAMAMPNLMPSSPGKTVVGAGAASFKGYNAVSAGVTRRSEDGKWLVNGAASVSQNGDVGVRAQVGFEF